jgi:hypothetical protein
MKIQLTALLLLASSSVVASTIRVEGFGTTRQEAKQDAFKSACEQAVKTIVISERQHKNDVTVKDEIITACSGYVDKYKIIKEERYEGQVYLTMDVTISDSKIADRFIVKNSDEQEVNGELVQDSYNSYLDGKLNNKYILETVVGDFPTQSFNIDQGKITFKSDRYNKLTMVIPYKVYWNKNFLYSLQESLNRSKYANKRHPLEDVGYKIIKSKVEYYTARQISLPDRSEQHSVAKISFDRNTYLFNDYTSNMVIYEKIMAGNVPVIAVEFTDNYGDTYLHSCHNMVASSNGQSLYHLGNRGLDIKFFTTSYINNNIYITMSGSLQNLYKVSLKIVSKNNCR